ncbi:hypothetical protein P4C99_16700 [Pontiellaceae bacterium B1224]|nr:hypothetical protein [Pontiellaceae bacterium B1224]
MKEVKTKYGLITDYLNLKMHDSDQPASILLTGHTELETPYGTLIPQYEVEDLGRKEHKYVLFHPNGTVRKVPLQDPQNIETNYGTIVSEMLLFYNDGALKKLFPLTGKLSGYWSEENEVALAEDLSLALPSGNITAKVISLGFFKSGSIRSITLWPGEIVSVNTPAGNIEARTGISFYEDGSIKSLEPALPTTVETLIGTLEAFDNDPDGVSGDINSLNFDPEGNVTSLSTTSSKVIVTIDSDTEKTYRPTEQESLCSAAVKVAVPLIIEFIGDKVRFNQSNTDVYDIADCSFKTEEYVADLSMPCYECA